MKIHGIINFQGSSLNGLSKNSSPNELSKLSAHSLEGVCWESAGSPLGVSWESAGSLLGVSWEFCKWSLQKSSPNDLFYFRSDYNLRL